MIGRRAAAVACGMALLAACGGDDGDAASSGRDTTAAATIPAPGTLQVVSVDSPGLPSEGSGSTVVPAAAPEVREPGGSDPAVPARGGARAGGTAPPAPPVADPLPGAQDPAAILQRTADVYRGIRSMRADFTMLVQNPLLRSRTASRGTLYQRRPDRILLDFSEPDGDRIVSDGTYFWVYYPSATPDQVIRTAASQAGVGGVDLQAQFVGNPAERFRYMLEGSENVGSRPAYVFTLVPREPTGYDRLKVWIDASDSLVRRFELTEPNGTVRLLEFSSIERNPDLSDDLFRFTPPPNVRVVTR